MCFLVSLIQSMSARIVFVSEIWTISRPTDLTVSKKNSFTELLWCLFFIMPMLFAAAFFFSYDCDGSSQTLGSSEIAFQRAISLILFSLNRCLFDSKIFKQDSLLPLAYFAPSFFCKEGL